MTIITAMIMSLLSATMVIENVKAQKTSIKKELMPIAWHPSRWWDWCIPGDEKKEPEKLWG